MLCSAGPHERPNIAFYIDDILGAHDEWGKQFVFLRDHFFPRMLWSQLKLSFSKLFIGMTRVKALGEMHEIGGRVRIKPATAEKIKNWPRPQEFSGVREFLGTCQSTRKWTEGYTEMARPLTRLTGNVDWVWNESEELSFQLMRKLCAISATLFSWNPQLAIQMFSDASGFGGGCYIRQLQNGEWRLIVYDSFTFNKSERNYDTYRRELRAIVYFGQKFAHMMRCDDISIWTDHKPLVGFMNAEFHEDIFARWAMKLRQLHVKLKYIQGKDNAVADGLSRVIFNDLDCEPDELVRNLAKEVEKHQDDDEWYWKSGKTGYAHMLKQLTDEDRTKRIARQGDEAVAAATVGWTSFTIPERETGPSVPVQPITVGGEMPEQMPPGFVQPFHRSATESYKVDYENDDWYTDVYRYCTRQEKPKGLNAQEMGAFNQKAARFVFHDRTNRLVYTFRGQWAPCLVKEEISTLLRDVHDRSGHFSSKIVMDKIRNVVYWPTMAKDVVQYIKGCYPCAKWANSTRSVSLSPIQTMEPFQLLGVDFIGPFMTRAGKIKYILNIVDNFSRAMFPEVTNAADARSAIKGITSCLLRAPAPNAIYFDDGTHFLNEQMSTFLRNAGIIMLEAPSGAKHAVGMVEKSNDILSKCFKKRREDSPDESWDLSVQMSAVDANARVIDHLGYSPLEILYGVKATSAFERSVRFSTYPDKLEVPDPEEMLPVVWEFMSKRAEIRETAMHRSIRAKDMMKNRYDKGVTPTASLKHGQWVMKQDTRTSRTKSESKWTGPFMIADFASEQGTSYKLVSKNGKVSKHTYYGDHLKLYEPREGYLRQPGEKAPNIPLTLRPPRVKPSRKATETARLGGEGGEVMSTETARL